MLSLLLDEQISYVVAEQILAKRPEIRIRSIYHWRDGVFAGVEDAQVLRAAAEDRLTVVTYDLATIPPLLVEWGLQGVPHAGSVLIDERTIASNDFGALIRALVRLWEDAHEEDWTNRITYLRP